MRMKRLFTFLAAATMFLTTNAQSEGDYVYTKNARYKITSGANLLPNGDFSNGTTGWTTDGGNELNVDTFAVEKDEATGTSYLKVYQKSSGAYGTGSSLYRSMPVEYGKSYVVSYQVKVDGYDGGNGVSSVSLSDNTKNYQNFLYSPTGDLKDENNVSLGSGQSYEEEWLTVNYAYTPQENGFILLHFYCPFVNTCFTNFSVKEAIEVPDDRAANKVIDRLQAYIDNPLFPNGRNDLEDFIGGLRASVESEDMAEYNSFLESVEEAISVFLDANAPDVSRFLVEPGFEKGSDAVGKAITWVGDKTDGWILESNRWTLDAADETDAAFPTIHLKRNINGSYRLSEGGFKETVKNMPAAKYIFTIRARAARYKNKNNVINEDYEPRGLKLFVNTDSTEMYPIATEDATRFDIIGEQKADGDLVLGFYMPEEVINNIEFDNAELRIIGWTQDQVNDYFDNKELVEIKAQLQANIEAAELLTTDKLYKYGIADLRTAIETAKAAKESAATVDDVKAAISELASAVSTFKKLNSQYTNLVNAIDKAEIQMAEDSYTNGRDELQAAINTAKDFLASLNDEQSIETDQAILAQVNTLNDAVLNFSYANAPGDEKYIFAKWAKEEGATFVPILGTSDEDQITTSSTVVLVRETADFAGHNLNGRFAFNGHEQFYHSLNPSHGLSLNNKNGKGVQMAVLNLKKGDMVTLDWVIADTKHSVYVASGNVTYKKEDGTWVTLTEADRKVKNENTQLVAATKKLGVGNKTRINFIMTEDGTFDIGLGSNSSTLRISHIGITDAKNVDGIETIISNGPKAADNVIYDLQGRRIYGKPANGIYIMNGKKVYVK